MIYKGLKDFSAFDSKLEMKYKALYLLNTMRKLGINSRKKFVDTAETYISLEINTKTLNKLYAFWEGREVTLIEEIEIMVKQLTEKQNECNNQCNTSK